MLGHSLTLAVIGLAACSVVFGVFAGPPWATREDRIDLHTDGLVMVARAKRTVICFDDVDTVWFVVKTVSSWLGDSMHIVGLRLVGRDGETHTVPLHFVDAEQVALAVVRACSSVHLAGALETVACGESLTFGSVVLSREAVTIRGQKTPWKDLQLVRYQPGRMVFFRRQRWIPWRTVRIDRVPHPTLFVKMVAIYAPRTEIDDPLIRMFG